MFADSLTAFVSEGLVREEAILVIAGAQRRRRLLEQLCGAGLDISAGRMPERLLLLDAAETLKRFMVNGWPDRRRFSAAIAGVIRDVAPDGRTVRAFGEMVALLWESRAYEATVRLEYLWDDFCARNGLTLLCGYPAWMLDTGPSSLAEGIQRAHSRVFHSG